MLLFNRCQRQQHPAAVRGAQQSGDPRAADPPLLHLGGGGGRPRGPGGGARAEAAHRVQGQGGRGGSAGAAETQN